MENEETPGNTPDTQVTDSDPNGGGPQGLAGDMGVSSERVGHVSGGVGTNGTKDTSEIEAPEDAPPEQSADPATGPEPQPDNDLPPHPFDPGTAPGHSHG